MVLPVVARVDVEVESVHGYSIPSLRSTSSPWKLSLTRCQASGQEKSCIPVNARHSTSSNVLWHVKTSKVNKSKQTFEEKKNVKHATKEDLYIENLIIQKEKSHGFTSFWWWFTSVFFWFKFFNFILFLKWCHFHYMESSRYLLGLTRSSMPTNQHTYLPT